MDHYILIKNGVYKFEFIFLYLVTMESLPYELIQYIYEYLTLPRDQLRFSLSCAWIYHYKPHDIARIHRIMALIAPSINMISLINYTCDQTLGSDYSAISYRGNVIYKTPNIESNSIYDPHEELHVFYNDRCRLIFTSYDYWGIMGIEYEYI